MFINNKSLTCGSCNTSFGLCGGLLGWFGLTRLARIFPLLLTHVMLNKEVCEMCSVDVVLLQEVRAMFQFWVDFREPEYAVRFLNF
jgi:hypothetical protein